ncbi:MAG TPA: TrkA family potassium uptake protein [Anaerolineales bacterium]|nr:TrkA family potassium uptake protein [Anaerolineales bacterium]
MQIIVVGCGRVGVELALALQGEHQVTVVDAHARAFDRLGTTFRGRCVQGDALDREVLLRAGIETADALAAVTASDNVNAIVARIAGAVFHVERVAARLYNPGRAPVYDKLNIQTVSSSSWGAHRLEELLTRPDLRPQAPHGRWVWQPGGS